MLKLIIRVSRIEKYLAATFGWLCVETIMQDIFTDFLKKAATFGWLCVETSRSFAAMPAVVCSHLRVAVC